ncbi:PepSY domain-containing protein [Pseudonocardia petroleophila]|uniref:PepSY domain-containing protein n=1 Tax=Pseudonocardia petroleophila TaxID=37331 RepID=A0A7G7MNK9_9PSEU|nr:PepSY domain-containing protein [Pseudonocardia petroleophila]QNG54370.1 PepSY domain-containing protein [Pseudonocardia petroleophila]
MTTTRIATLAATASIALVALGGTALALGADDTPAPTPVPVSAGTVDDPTPTTAPTTTGGATPTSSAGSTPDDPADRERAVTVALERIGGGRVTGVERETEHGRTEWKVEIVEGGVEHDVRVDTATGAVTRVDLDDDRGGDDRGGDDRLGDDRGGDDRGGDDRGGDDRGGSGRGGHDDGPGHDVGDDHGGDDD